MRWLIQIKAPKTGQIQTKLGPFQTNLHTTMLIFNSCQELNLNFYKGPLNWDFWEIVLKRYSNQIGLN